MRRVRCYCLAMGMPLYLGIGASVLQLVGFGVYNRQIFLGTSVPNTAAWTLWAFLTILGASSYFVITGDFAKSILFFATAAANVGTFGYSLLTGKFHRMDSWDYIALVFGLVAGLVWWWYQSAADANIIVTFAVAIAFCPLYRVVWTDPSQEKPLPWFMWATGYALVTLVVVLRWNNNYLDLVYPVSMCMLHFVVGLLCQRVK